MKTTKFYSATVYHGGSLAGMGIYGSTKNFKSIDTAERAGQKLKIKCKKMCGGCPTHEILVSFEWSL